MRTKLQVFPNWKMREFFATDVIQNVLYNDAATWTRPMSFYAQTPDKIFSLFDSVSYDKGKIVLTKNHELECQLT